MEWLFKIEYEKDNQFRKSYPPASLSTKETSTRPNPSPNHLSNLIFGKGSGSFCCSSVNINHTGEEQQELLTPIFLGLGCPSTRTATSKNDAWVACVAHLL